MTRQHRHCGGTILSGGTGESAHEYCPGCHAYRYLDDPDAALPTGTDLSANRAAWDRGDARSPDPVTS